MSNRWKAASAISFFPLRGTAGFWLRSRFHRTAMPAISGEMTSDEKHGIPADGSRAFQSPGRVFQELARVCLDP